MCVAALMVTFASGFLPEDQAAPVKVPSAPGVETLSMKQPLAADSPAMIALAQFVNYHFSAMTTGSTDAVKDSRSALVTALRKTEATAVFRRTMLSLIKPRLTDLLATNDTFRITNGLLVVRQVKDAEANELLLGQCNSETQSNASVRIAATGMLPSLMTGGSIPAAQLDGLARRIRSLISTETNWIAASQDLAALNTMATVTEKAKLLDQAASIRLDIVKALDDLVGRSIKLGDPDLAAAIFRGLVALRNQVLSMQQDEQKKLSAVAQPMLAAVQNLPNAPAGESGAKGKMQLEVDGAREAARQLVKLLPKSAS